ncbi:SDR family NAD(P)-dependent oxidoreductase [Halovulum sp. GXIMD14794]
MSNDVMKSGNVAVVTGGAAGIGLAAAQRFAKRGMTVVVVDVRKELFPDAETSLREAGAPEVMARAVDVSDRAAVDAFRDEVIAAYGHIDLLMCNAGIQPGSDIFDSKQTWARVLEVNLWGVVNCCQSIAPGMIERGRPAIVINTGSKQGITTPPGDPAYNTSKAGVKVFTEALAHHLREVEANVSAHLLIPGFVFTDLTRHDRTEKPSGAWTPDQTADFLMERLAMGDFYILCPDNDVSREMDQKRMAWAMGDIIENRPPLSRWHKAWSEAFEDFLAKDD